MKIEVHKLNSSNLSAGEEPVAALFSLADLIIGPILAFAAALMPTRLKRSHGEQIENKTSVKS